MKKILNSGREIIMPKFDKDVLSFALKLMDKYDLSFEELCEIINEI